MFYDPADRFDVVEYLLSVCQPGYKVVQVAMEIVGLLHCLFKLRLKLETNIVTSHFHFDQKSVIYLFLMLNVQQEVA